MPDKPPTLTHFRGDSLGINACTGTAGEGMRSWNPREVNCFACRKTPAFKQAQRVHEQLAHLMPMKLSEILAELPLPEPETAPVWDLEASKNERGMYTIEEFIHHGDYRSRRRVEVYAINETTVDAVLQSSAYCYGSWAHAEPQYYTHRKTALAQLVEDLKHGRENRSIGWSTFKLV